MGVAIGVDSHKSTLAVAVLDVVRLLEHPAVLAFES